MSDTYNLNIPGQQFPSTMPSGVPVGGGGSVGGVGTGGLILEAAATGVAAIGQIIAADRQQTASVVTAGTIAETAELNAQLIESGSELNAEVHDFNAAALDAQATDAITQAKVQETLFRQQIKQTIGSQRASYAGQGVEIASGSPLDVQKDTAYQGELDALQIRVNAARTAWGYSEEAQGETLQAQATRKLGTLQAANTRQVGAASANAARITGTNVASAANWGAATTIIGGSANILTKKYGF